LAALWFNPANTALTAREFFFDRLLTAHPRSGPDNGVRLIDIDQESLKQLGRWPWRREQLAMLTGKLGQYGPHVIAIDILLEGEDRIGPRAVLSRLAEQEKSAQLTSLASQFPHDDERLAHAISGGPPVVLAIGAIQSPSALTSGTIPPLVLARTHDGAFPLQAIRAGRFGAPPETLTKAAAGFGVSGFDTDADGWVRRFGLLFENAAGIERRLQAGFALETIRVAEEAGSIIVNQQQPFLEAGEVLIHAPRDSMMRLYPRPPGYWTAHTIPAWKIMAGEAGNLKPGQLLIVGSSAPEAGAYLPAAAGGAAPTLLLQGEAVDLLRSGKNLHRVAGAIHSEFIAAFATAGLAIFAAITALPALAALAALLLAAIPAIAAWALFLGYGVLFDPLPAIAAILAGVAAASLAVFNRVRSNRALIEKRFARYLDPAVVELLARDPSRLRIKPEWREVTALFTDLEGFTPFSERTQPDKLLITLDAYFEMLAKIVTEHGGMVDKVVGDALHGFFNMPLDQADHATQAVRCARAIHEAAETFRKQEPQLSLGLGRTRIGVDTGWASVGDVGGRNKLDYTAHGEAINRAARLQGMARETPSGILIGAGAVAKLSSTEGLVKLGAMTPRGLSQAQDVYTIVEQGAP
ncbi:MAG: adenylate/guanylate cyclase domain-containing protein, partial [Alphaproteobacteria bacterium]|nr:adenylate/guanylate cyclase domain-containing protein [Alphaproteobacteria bacterium]